MKDNYKPFQVDHVIAVPDTSKYHFITNPDYNENPFESSMKNGIIMIIIQKKIDIYL